jgi:hypothetical protein
MTDRKGSPPNSLDIPLDEAVTRFLQTDPAEMTGPLFRQNIQASTKPPAGPRQAKASPSAVELGIEVMNSMPLTVQRRLATTSGDAYWCSLSVEGLTSSPGDLMLKHGVLLGGEWSMLGILDALPSQRLSDQQSELQNAMTIATLGPLVGGIGVMADALRPMIGRPADAYGITPLLVFREVAARS